jgi:hypothetical protein
MVCADGDPLIFLAGFLNYTFENQKDYRFNEICANP